MPAGDVMQLPVGFLGQEPRRDDTGDGVYSVRVLLNTSYHCSVSVLSIDLDDVTVNADAILSLWVDPCVCSLFLRRSKG